MRVGIIDDDAINRVLATAVPRAATMPAPPPPMAPMATVGLRPLTILLAEDNLVNQRVAAGLLRRRGHTVAIANNGIEALAALENQRFDLVLMDLQMPQMGGLEATRRIRDREREGGRQTPIVAMTADAMTGDRERCLAAGMDGYLSKPVDPCMLYAVVEQHTAAAVADIAPSLPVPIDVDAFMARLGGDVDLRDDVIGLFLADCPQRLAAIKAAVDGGDPDLYPYHRSRPERGGGKSVGGRLVRRGGEPRTRRRRIAAVRGGAGMASSVGRGRCGDRRARPVSAHAA